MNCKNKVQNFNINWDLSTIPPGLFQAELTRRAAEQAAEASVMKSVIEPDQALSNAKDFILAGVTDNGLDVFFTGKAGLEYVNEKRSEAVSYSREHAYQMADALNDTRRGRGFTFYVVAKDVAEAA